MLFTPTRTYPMPHVGPGPVNAVSQAGGFLITETIRTVGLGVALSETMAPWKRPFSTHDPGKILLDFAAVLVLGGGPLSDLDNIRDEPSMNTLILNRTR